MHPRLGTPLRKINWAALLTNALIVTLFSIAFLRTGWVSEDAFITFRTIDNALNGLGLTWNPGERVQTFTHPLWFGLLLPVVAIFGDPYWASIGLSYLCLLLVLWALAKIAGTWRVGTFLAVTSLLWCKSFVDYSSSGLENPLTHVLLLLFVLVWLKRADGPRKTLALSVIVSALFLSRPDAVVLIVPGLIAYVWHARSRLRPHITPALLGALPAIVWLAFSLFYYGSPVPNTALAKVQTGLSGLQKAEQAVAYFAWTFERDIFSLALMIAGTAWGLFGRSTILRSLSIGLLAWAGYLFYVGADYMGGRFFSAPVLIAATIVAIRLEQPRSKMPSVVMACLLLVGASSLQSTLMSPSNYHVPTISDSGIADERGYYYPALGILPTLKWNNWFRHPWLHEGAAIKHLPGWYTRCTIGMVAYSAGPGLRWIDPLALTDPFLARLPTRSEVRVGHYERAFPAGFLDSMTTGRNVIHDPLLRALYHDVDLATRGVLLNPDRLGAIWRLNTGQHRRAAIHYNPLDVGLPGVEVKTREPGSCYGIFNGMSTIWKLDGPPVRVRRIAFNNN